MVSIIMPSHNSSKFISESIESIINQSYKDWELLITDDASTDNTIKIVESYLQIDERIKLFKLTKNSGAGIARNNSIKEAKGKYIAFCDSDDQWMPEKLSKQIAFMRKNRVRLCYTAYDVIDEDNVKIGAVFPPLNVNYHKMLKNNYIGCLTAVYDSQKLGKQYMPIIRKRQDWALWLSILKKIDYAKGMKEKLSIYRERRSSISDNKIELLKYNFQLYHKIEGYSYILSVFLVIRFLYYYFKKKKK